MIHIPVLLKEAIEYLNPKEGDTILDATFGGGGHARAILERIGGKGKLIGLDQDKNALEHFKSEIRSTKSETNLILVNENFRNLDRVLENLNIKKINGALFDLGFSSDQLDESGRPACNACGVATAGRGFSFQRDEPLLMTLKSEIESGDLTAREIVNQWREEEIADVLYKYGEERYSRRIAKAIIEVRRKKKIETTFELVDIIRSSVPAVYRNNRRINCATRTFQALRIAVNDELGALEEGLRKAWNALDKEGRMVVISFHSLEDRVVKNFFRDKKQVGEGKILTKKPVVPAEEEIKNNPRSRSAKLRAYDKSNNREN